MESIPAYKTRDGKVFEDLTEALQHETVLEFSDWYSEHTLYGNYGGSYVDIGYLLDWLTDNRDMVLKLLGKT